MEVSRRDFLRLSVAAGSGTALSGLIGSGVNLGRRWRGRRNCGSKAPRSRRASAPICSVGCGTLVHTIDGQIVNIEGDPRSPHNEGTLCPKGAAIFQLHVNPNRPTQVLHRDAGATDWEVWDLERAMNRIAELVKKTRDETFIEKLPNGKLVNMTPAIFSLGGATLEIEFNHVHQKLMRGLGHRRHRESGADMTQL